MRKASYYDARFKIHSFHIFSIKSSIPYSHLQLVLIDMILSNCITSISIIRFDSLLSDSDRIPMSEAGAREHKTSVKTRPRHPEQSHTGTEEGPSGTKVPFI